MPTYMIWWPQTISRAEAGNQTHTALVRGQCVNHWARWTTISRVLTDTKLDIHDLHNILDKHQNQMLNSFLQLRLLSVELCALVHICVLQGYLITLSVCHKGIWSLSVIALVISKKHLTQHFFYRLCKYVRPFTKPEKYFFLSSM